MREKDETGTSAAAGSIKGSAVVHAVKALRTPSPRYRAAALQITVALLVVVSLASAQGPSISYEIAAQEAQWLHRTARIQVPELLDLAGDFGGYAGALREVTDPLGPGPDQLAGGVHTALFGALEPGAAASVEAFWRGSVGRKILWLRHGAATSTGHRGLPRSAREVAARTERDDPAARFALVSEIDALSLNTETTLAVADRLFQLIDAAAARITAAVGKEGEWAHSASEIRDHLRGPYRDQLRLEFLHRLRRLDVAELQALHAYARSAEGQAYFQARRAALEAGADAIVDAALPRAQELLDAELREAPIER